jgi:hypothetical protein
MEPPPSEGTAYVHLRQGRRREHKWLSFVPSDLQLPEPPSRSHSRALGSASVVQEQCCLTLRSSGPPPARHLGREPARPIIRLAAKAPCRWRPLSSNVRRRRRLHWSSSVLPSPPQLPHAGQSLGAFLSRLFAGMSKPLLAYARKPYCEHRATARPQTTGRRSPQSRLPSPCRRPGAAPGRTEPCECTGHHRRERRAPLPITLRPEPLVVRPRRAFGNRPA